MNRNRQHYPIDSAEALQQRFGLYADQREKPQLASTDVPAGLHALLPLAAQWGISCDITRHDFIDQRSRRELELFAQQLAPLRPAIAAWLDALGPDTASWPATAIAFLYLERAWDRVELLLEPEAVRAERIARLDAAQRPVLLRRAMESATGAFHRKDYAAVVTLLAPHAAALPPLAARQYHFALARCQPDAADAAS